MKSGLHVSADLSLPVNAVTETFGILAVRGAGKSNAAVVMAECMFRAGLPFVAVDPKGDWWGIRAAGDRPGLPIPIFGGDHADVPLEPGGGTCLADIIAESRLSCVLDVSEFSEGEKTRFLIDFGATLLRKNRHPIHLFLEEADDYIPQRPFREQARCVEVFQKLVKRGRFHGIGCTLITQRSAAINKDVLYMVETMFVLRTVGPKDRDTVEGWIEHQGGSKEILGTLPSLKSGEAWVYSPNFLRLEKPERIRFHRRGTFDSGATPEVGATDRPPATLADVDLGAIRTKMAATIEKAKAEDPKALKARIADLERAAAKAKTPETKEVRVEVPIVNEEDMRTLFVATEEMRQAVAGLEETRAFFKDTAAALDSAARDVIAAITRASRQSPPTAGVRANREDFAAPTRPARPKAPEADGDGTLAPVHRRILDGLAELLALGLNAPARVQVALMAGYGNPKSGGFVKALGLLSSQHLIHYPDGQSVSLTDLGEIEAHRKEVPRTVAELQERFLSLLQPVHRRILVPLIESFPEALDRAVVGNQIGYTNPKSGGFVKALGRLSSLGLISYPSGSEVVATRLLFPEGGR